MFFLETWSNVEQLWRSRPFKQKKTEHSISSIGDSVIVVVVVVMVIVVVVILVVIELAATAAVNLALF